MSAFNAIAPSHHSFVIVVYTINFSLPTLRSFFGPIKQTCGLEVSALADFYAIN